MLDSSYVTALKVIYNNLSDKDVVWALTGSTAFIIQGMKLPANDIDVQTDKDGAYIINEALKQFEEDPVVFSSTDTMRSYIGLFRLENISVEVMGDIQKKFGGAWEEIIDLNPLIRYVDYENMTLPVLDLKYESAAYRKMGRFERADIIDKFINETEG
jgi:hypothetical protein